MPRAAIYPAKHFVTTRPSLERAVGHIRVELGEHITQCLGACRDDRVSDQMTHGRMGGVLCDHN